LREDAKMEEGEYAERGNYGRKNEWRFSEMHMASVPRLGIWCEMRRFDGRLRGEPRGVRNCA
jgi:hypothetical protein